MTTTATTSTSTHLVLVLLFVVPSLGAQASSQPAPDTGEEAGSEPGGFLGELMAADDLYGSKFLDLARAIPGEQYSWRPNEGVKSVSEVFLHAAGANFGLARSLGVPTPEDLPEDLESLTDKERVVEVLGQSFQNVHRGLGVLARVDIEQSARVGETETTIRGALLQYILHHGEHLGQLIAYARSLGITPPWSN